MFNHHVISQNVFLNTPTPYISDAGNESLYDPFNFEGFKGATFVCKLINA